MAPHPERSMSNVTVTFTVEETINRYSLVELVVRHYRTSGRKCCNNALYEDVVTCTIDREYAPTSANPVSRADIDDDAFERILDLVEDELDPAAAAKRIKESEG
jgi:hypothetical protein